MSMAKVERRDIVEKLIKVEQHPKARAWSFWKSGGGAKWGKGFDTIMSLLLFTALALIIGREQLEVGESTKELILE